MISRFQRSNRTSPELSTAKAANLKMIKDPEWADVGVRLFQLGLEIAHAERGL
jgi:hypothetical protein